MRAIVKAVWRRMKSRPDRYGIYCGGGAGCRERLAIAIDNPEGGVIGPEGERVTVFPDPGFVLGPDGYWRRSSKYRDHFVYVRLRFEKWRYRKGYRSSPPPAEPVRGYGRDALRFFKHGIEVKPFICPACEATNGVVKIRDAPMDGVV